MSDSSKIKGRKTAKKNHMLSNKGRRKHLPYGSVKKMAIDSEEDFVSVVNKKKTRQDAKKVIRKEMEDDGGEQ